MTDDTSFRLLRLLADVEDIHLEPSALAGMSGPYMLQESEAGMSFLKENNLNKYMKNSTHIIWATGGSMVPEEEMKVYYEASNG